MRNFLFFTSVAVIIGSLTAYYLLTSNPHKEQVSPVRLLQLSLQAKSYEGERKAHRAYPSGDISFREEFALEGKKVIPIFLYGSQVKMGTGVPTSPAVAFGLKEQGPASAKASPIYTDNVEGTVASVPLEDAVKLAKSMEGYTLVPVICRSQEGIGNPAKDDTNSFYIAFAFLK